MVYAIVKSFEKSSESMELNENISQLVSSNVRKILKISLKILIF